MDESQSSLIKSLPPFLSKMYEMVNDHSTNAIVSWSQSNSSFIVWNQLEFTSKLLPRFFKHNNYSSFIRQLNTYGFRKIDPKQGEFANKNFIRGRPDLLQNIRRQKPVHSHSLKKVQQNTRLSSSPLTESERQVYNNRISTLKNGNQLLLSELEKHEEEKRGSELQLQQLKERFIQIEERHKLMLSNLSTVLQKPNTFPELELPGKKRRLAQTDFHEEIDNEHNHNGDSQLSSIKEFSEQLESSLTLWDDMVRDVSQTYVSCGSDLELNETSCVEGNSPNFSCPQVNVDAQRVTHVVDVNSEPPLAAPAASDTAASIQQQTGPNTAVMVAGVNDKFWEQFLTEDPGSDNQEVYSERKGSSGGKNVSFGWVDQGKW